MKEKEVSIGLVQMSMSHSMDVNLETAIKGINEATEHGAQIIALPELFRSPYFCIEEKSSVDYSEPLVGETMNTLSELAREKKVTIVAGSIYETSDDGKFNTSFVCSSEGEVLGSYRKTHIPHDPAFFEQNYFESGNSNYQVFKTRVGNLEVTIGVLICYDQWFPEAARTLALMGADIIFYPTAIGVPKGASEPEGSWQEAWKTVQRGHAVANATIVCPINRVGVENGTEFWGGSFICNAFGKVLAEGGKGEELVISTVDLSHAEFVKEGWRFFKERRPDTYSLLCKKSTEG